MAVAAIAVVAVATIAMAVATVAIAMAVAIAGHTIGHLDRSHHQDDAEKDVGEESVLHCYWKYLRAKYKL